MWSLVVLISRETVDYWVWTIYYQLGGLQMNQYIMHIVFTYHHPTRFSYVLEVLNKQTCRKFRFICEYFCKIGAPMAVLITVVDHWSYTESGATAHGGSLFIDATAGRSTHKYRFIKWLYLHDSSAWTQCAGWVGSGMTQVMLPIRRSLSGSSV